MGTAVQHTFDVESWFSVEQAAGAGNSFVEILEEHSLEDDVQSILYIGLISRSLVANPLLREPAFNTFERTVPTPPPDLA